MLKERNYKKKENKKNGWSRKNKKGLKELRTDGEIIIKKYEIDIIEKQYKKIEENYNKMNKQEQKKLKMKYYFIYLLMCYTVNLPYNTKKTTICNLFKLYSSKLPFYVRNEIKKTANTYYKKYIILNER